MDPAGTSLPVVTASPPAKSKFDLDELYDTVESRTAYYIIDNRPHLVLALPTARRKRYIPSKLREELQRAKRTWGICQYVAVGKELKQAQCDMLMEAASSKAATALSAIQLTPATPDNPMPLDGFHWQLHPEHAQNNQILLPPPAKAAPQQKIAVLNGDKKNSLTISGQFKDTKLSPGEAVFFVCKTSQGKNYWQLMGQYQLTRTEVRTNPLIRDFGPRLTNKSRQGKGNKMYTDGEYFLPLPIVTDLATQQSADKNTQYPVFVLEKDNEDFIQKVQEQLSSEAAACSILLHSPGSEHILAARLIRRGNEIVCYLHEGLEHTGEQPKEFRKGICSTLYQAFPDATIRCLTPENTLQRDYSSCGVIALKALRAFRKTDDFDNRIYAEALTTCRPAIWLPPPPDAKPEDSPYSDTQVTPGLLSMEKMAPRLLKMYQGSLKAIPQELLEMVVSGENTTLKEYLGQHSREKGETEKHMFNLAPIGKRYIYANKWFSRQPQPAPLTSPCLPEVPAARASSRKGREKLKRIHAKEPFKKKRPKLEFSSPFSDTFAAQTALEANETLKATGYPEIEVTEYEFRMTCEFYAFIHNREAAFCDHKAVPLAEWLTELLECDIQPGSKEQLLMDWCLFAIRTDPLEWYDRDLAWVLKRLQKYIRDLPSDQSRWRNPSESGDEEDDMEVPGGGAETLICSETMSDITNSEASCDDGWRKTPIDTTHPFYHLLELLLKDESNAGYSIKVMDKEQQIFEIPDMARLSILTLGILANIQCKSQQYDQADPARYNPLYLPCCWDQDIFSEGRIYKLAPEGLMVLDFSQEGMDQDL